MYDRTVPVYTFSKTYAMTGLRLGYLAIADEALRDRVRKLLFFTSSNVSSVVQYGGIGALEGSQDVVAEYRRELRERRDLFYAGIGGGGIFSGAPPAGAFYAFVRFDREWRKYAKLELCATSEKQPQTGVGQSPASARSARHGPPKPRRRRAALPVPSPGRSPST